MSKQQNTVLNIFIYFFTRVRTVSGMWIYVGSSCFCTAWCKGNLIGRFQTGSEPLFGSPSIPFQLRTWENPLHSPEMGQTKPSMTCQHNSFSDRTKLLKPDSRSIWREVLEMESQTLRGQRWTGADVNVTHSIWLQSLVRYVKAF